MKKMKKYESWESEQKRLCRAALWDLLEVESGTGNATPEQLLAAATKHGADVSYLESVYLEYAERSANDFQ
jgi:hypothetical protein